MLRRARAEWTDIPARTAQPRPTGGAEAISLRIRPGHGGGPSSMPRHPRSATPCPGPVGDRLGKVRAAGDLVRPLAAHTAQANADLVCAHEADRLHSHMIDRRRGTIRRSAGWRKTASRSSIRIAVMTRCRMTTGGVPFSPRHRRDWRTLWRRCRCGLPAPCVDRLVPAPPKPYPPRGPAEQSGTGPAHSDNVVPDRQKPRLAAPPRFDVPRQRQGSGAQDDHTAGRQDGRTAGRHDSRTTGRQDDRTAGRHDGRTARRQDDRTAGRHDSRTAGRHDHRTAGRHGSTGREEDEPCGGRAAEEECGWGRSGGSRSIGDALAGQAVGRAAVPRPRHLEPNVGRAGNLTPGQRHRAHCNDPFKNHLHRRRDRR
ncbi:hypothetical protein SAMN06264365_101454 [Actinoplanes regularis]|uniref:Uncharacterized protein n=1 Tax=Actinoplanes regularis TaxID=52697 RepID=A0A238V2J7_9ACTN|nr:hypothetical protein SAMN06264365_101454 [Actinoplanes regularis]